MSFYYETLKMNTITTNRRQRKRLRRSKILRRLEVRKIKTPSRSTWKVTIVDRLRHDHHADLIQRLNNRMMHDVIEQIFSYLDYDSLTNSEKVSAEWDMILDNERIWKALLKRNLASNRFWRIIFDLVKPPNNNSEDVLTKRTCKNVGEFQLLFMDLMNSCLSLISTNLQMLSKVIEILRVMGFGNFCLDDRTSEEEFE